jgi:NAD(P)-dependent dehydrogenase (short-subunit alcohol dehydrogenase family)
MNVRNLLSLEGRIAIVTGGRGLYGSAISAGLAEMGATVIIASRNEEKCEEYAGTLRDQGLNAFGAQLDLASDESINRLVNDTIEKYGRIDILVNNAMLNDGDNNLENISRAELELGESVNINGQIMISKQVVQHMVRQNSGNIINISSIRGIDSPHFPFYPEGQTSGINYNSCKWALIGVTKWMAGFYGKNNIRVNCICPGGYNPHMDNNLKPAFVQTYIDNCPLKRWANEDDIKGPVVFLASDASGYVTGLTLTMDGGWTIW